MFCKPICKPICKPNQKKCQFCTKLMGKKNAQKGLEKLL
jgi:hypothetical protein